MIRQPVKTHYYVILVFLIRQIAVFLVGIYLNVAGEAAQQGMNILGDEVWRTLPPGYPAPPARV